MTRPPVQLNEVLAAKAGNRALVESLQRLVKLAAEQRTGGSRVAAKVILSCYNSSDYPLDVADLGTLDERHFEDALNVIRLRVEHMKEPHEFFVDGDRLFNHIAQAYGLRPEHFDPL